MKKLSLFLCLLFVAPVFADQFQDDPDWISISTSANASPTAVIVANGKWPGRNCLTKLTWSGSNFLPAGVLFSILDNGTTTYSVTYTTGPIIDYWDFKNPLCSSPGATTYFTISTGSYRVNAQGFLRPR